jgi:phosphomannomutase
VIQIGNEPNGTNINDGCGSTHPEAMCEKVRELRADIGIALDGDADRVIIADDKGQVVDGDQLMALIATSWAKRGELRGGGLVATIMSNLGLERYLADQKLTLARTKVGDRYVVEHMRAHGHNVGGEQSGHIVLSDFSTTGDGLVTALQLLSVVAQDWRADGKLSRPGIVATIMSNLGLERYLGSLGLSLARTPVGDRYVLEHMREHGYNVGGEQSGHMILSDYCTTGDGLVAAMQVMAVVKRRGKPVSEVCHAFDPLPQILKNVRFKGGKPLETESVAKVIQAAKQKLGNEGRLVIRPSGTEPVIRVMAEGDDRLVIESIVDEVCEAVSAAA